MKSIKEKYIISEILGEGSFGRVYKAIDKRSRQVVALKQIKNPRSALYTEEVRALDHLKHPTIVALQDVVYAGRSVYLVFEYVEATLQYHIQRSIARNCWFLEDQIRNLTFQILKGLDFMHRERRFMHRDLKPANLLVNNQGVIKISDLGSATEIDTKEFFEDYVTTRSYRAPEMLIRSYAKLKSSRSFIYDHKVDMWSVGTIIAELYLLAPLFRGINSDDQLKKICEVIGAPSCDSSIGKMINAGMLNIGKLEPEIGCGFRQRILHASDSALDLIGSLCCWDPAKRPSADEALRHPFFTQRRDVNAMSYAQVAKRRT